MRLEVLDLEQLGHLPPLVSAPRNAPRPFSACSGLDHPMKAGHFGPNNFYRSLIDLSRDAITQSLPPRRFFIQGRQQARELGFVPRAFL
jgi:hypothetical protein